MKDINELQRLAPEDLERIASDSSVKVPAELKASLEALAGASELLDERPAAAGVISGLAEKRLGRQSSGRRSQGLRTTWYWAVPAVAAALVAAVLVFRSAPKEPEDTFSDPYLAYAEVQKAFGQISRKGEEAASIAGSAVPVFEKTEELINRIMK
ncbi:MAG: hypothetical protein K6F58_07980 [Bacteroidales bacterium]|nr:hypothetical protein [Bacteroidales bacterium]